jgi:aminoglycoside/choline kinase family phosphotransferase
MIDGTSEWIHQHVKNVVSIEAAQVWQLSQVFRIRTTGGDVFFKSSTHLAHSADEPRLTALLAQLYPADVPEVIATDAERGWMIIGDVGVNLRTAPDFQDWHTALMRLVELQHDSRAQIDPLLASGCPDTRPDQIEAQIDPALANEAMFSGLEADEIARLRALAPILYRNNRLLEGADFVSATLVHGDFLGGNIGCKDGKLRFFDWSESCIAHPFFDLPVILRDAENYFPAEQVNLLRDGYLACWEDGQRQWQIALPVAALHHAIAYNNVAELVAPDQPRVRVARWLRQLLSTAA